MIQHFDYVYPELSDLIEKLDLKRQQVAANKGPKLNIPEYDFNKIFQVDVDDVGKRLASKDFFIKQKKKKKGKRRRLSKGDEEYVEDPDEDLSRPYNAVGKLWYKTWVRTQEEINEPPQPRRFVVRNFWGDSWCVGGVIWKRRAD